MSSLTDIIFLLLIFFMLTSNFVRIQPFPLPKSDSKTVAPISVVVTIETDGRMTVNNQDVPSSAIETAIRQELAKVKENRENMAVTIVAEVGTKFDEVIKVMNAAARLRVKAIIATEPNT